jgi:putative cell wall-binding protein
LTITIPTADLSTFLTSTATDVVPVALQISGPNGVSENFNVSSGLPTITQTNGAAISTTNGPGVTANSPVAAVYPQLATAATGVTGSGLATAGLTATALTTTTASTSNPTGVVEGNTLVFGVSGSETGSPLTFYISNLHADGTNAGVVTVTVSAGTPSPPSSATGSTPNAISIAAVTAKAIGSATLYTVGSLPTAIYGQTADATAAAEFDHQFVSVSTSGTATCTDNNAAVVATDHDFLDALSASFLEKSLGTGVLITPQTSAGPDLLAALKYAGVQRVYIVGGPLAINQSVINTISSTPAYTCGGLSPTGSNIQVFGPIYGQTADQTAAAIDNYAPVPASATMSFAGAYSAATSTTGGGLYNQTLGSATTTAPAGSQPTAIVVANTDFQDDMSASGLAYKYGLPIVLTSGSSLGVTASSELTKLGIKQVIALGGNLALSNSVVTSIQGMGISVMRIAGYDYTQTAADIAQFEAQQLGWTSSTVLVAQGAYWSDAIAAAPLSAINEQPILLTEGPTKGVGTYTDAVLKLAGTPSNGLGGTNPPVSGAQTTTTIQVLGGPLAITASQIAEMQAALASGATS